jgi:hypothetical protein
VKPLSYSSLAIIMITISAYFFLKTLASTLMSGLAPESKHTGTGRCTTFGKFGVTRQLFAGMCTG